MSSNGFSRNGHEASVYFKDDHYYITTGNGTLKFSTFEEVVDWARKEGERRIKKELEKFYFPEEETDE